PATAFNSTGLSAQGRVFFVGTKFNPPGTDCVSSFDSILFAAGAGSGLAAYDFGLSFQMSGEKAISVRVDRGRLVVDQGLSAGRLPTPPAPPAALAGASGTGAVYLSKFRPGSFVCRY
ncbi:MAG TPA: hypothetical protein VLI67_01215, partial [Vicinamibacteria bacterium]|nr:hypothetical protein [Vicinamibacteria bacterium]